MTSMAAKLAFMSPCLNFNKRVFRGPVFPPESPLRARFNGEKLNGLMTKAILQVGNFVEGGLKNLKKVKGLGFDVVNETEFREKRFLGMRKTKLVCTVGPACCSYEELERLALAGMNVVRLNLCHNTKEWHKDVIRKIKKLNQEKGFCVFVMIDTEGSQIHVADHGASSTVKAEVFLRGLE